MTDIAALYDQLTATANFLFPPNVARAKRRLEILLQLQVIRPEEWQHGGNERLRQSATALDRQISSLSTWIAANDSNLTPAANIFATTENFRD